MKKLLVLLTLLLFTVDVKAAMTFEEAFKDSNKPMAVIVYANWATDYSEAINRFRVAGLNYINDYNFVELNIADEDAKNYTEIYPIVAKLPYIMLYRGRGKVSRYLDRNCTSDISCIESKLNMFISK